MTNPAILEALARTILKNSNADISPTPDLPSDKNPIVKLMREWETAMSQAAAVLELVGPERLDWSQKTAETLDDGIKLHLGPYSVRMWDNQLGTRLDYMGHPLLFETAANGFTRSIKAAAQAHADAAHWANTPIGKLVGVV